MCCIFRNPETAGVVFREKQQKNLESIRSVSGLVQYRQKRNKDSIRKRSLCPLHAEDFPSVGKRACDFCLYTFPNICIYINV
jgi:hypothetical protein